MKRIGNTLPNQQPAGTGWSRSSGHFSRFRRRGHKREIEAFIQRLEADESIVEWDYDPEEGTPLATLTWTVGRLDENDDSETQWVNDWNLDANEIELDIFDHPKALAIEKAEPGKLRFIQRLVETLEPGADLPTFFQTDVSISLNIWANQLTSALLRGVSKWPFSQQVVRNTVTVAPGVALTLNRHARNTVISTANLFKNEPSIPAYIRLDMEAGFWRVIRPRRATAARGMAQIEREWVFVEDFDPFFWTEVK